MSTEIFKIEEEMIKKMEHKVAEGKTCSMTYVGRSKNKNDFERILSLIIDNQALTPGK